jgi:hypothetical protein
MQVPDRWWDRFKDKPLGLRHREPELEDVQHTRAALAMCENIDWNVGRIDRKLGELGIAGKTIVVYFCDNGPNGFRWNGGMKGRKGSTDEGGVRSPLIIRWPDAIDAGKQISRISAAIDLLPTLTDLAGIPRTNSAQLDGVSLKELLLADPADWQDRMIFSHWNNRVSVRTQQFRLDWQGKLYDMPVDPGQRHDVADRYSDLTEKLQSAADQWKKDVLNGYDDDDRPFLIGHPIYRWTQLPARDGVPHGNIRRSNRFPNCSFFTNWISVDDRITWDVEVAAAGRYQVEVYYSCPAADVGSTIELSFRGSTVTAKVLNAHDPPLRGGEHDRVERVESYIKDFRPLDMGTLELPAGRGTLTLRAVDIPGSHVIDFRLMMFRRLGE